MENIINKVESFEIYKNENVISSSTPWIQQVNNAIHNITNAINSLKIQSGNTPIDEKAAQTLIFGECFVVGQILFFPLLVHILILPLDSHIGISSTNIVLDQSFAGYLYFLADLTRLILCISLNIGDKVG